jgi:dTDP-4-amino-4,6-dideoxygalactose transaminase
MSTPPLTRQIPFIDLQAQRRALDGRIESAMARVLDHGRFILGPEVEEFEGRLADWAGAGNAVTCANGTDALVLALMALGLRPGEAVIVPSFTFCATAECVALVGGVPVFADVRSDTFNLDAGSARAAFRVASDRGLSVRGILGVGLFGQAPQYDQLCHLAAEHGAWVIDDAAQSFGADTPYGRVGTLARITATSFYPAKPLGCYGDGGALFTDDDDLAACLRSLRMHGQGQHQYDNVVLGQNSRLDTLQAAILIEKLAIFDDELERRRTIADRYSAALADVLAVPSLLTGYTSSWAQYTVLAAPGRRGAIRAHLQRCGVPTAVYYPKPLHRQGAYAQYPAASDLTVSDELAERALSLPMHAYLDEETQDFIVATVREALQRA